MNANINEITEIIPENMPDWCREAMMEGQLFSRLLDKIENLNLENGHLRHRFESIKKWCSVDGKETLLVKPVLDLLNAPIPLSRLHLYK